MEFLMGPRSAPKKIQENYGSRGVTGHGNSSNVSGAGDQKQIKRVTEERNRARTLINQKTQEMVNTALEAVKSSNGANAQVISMAQMALQQALSASQAQASRPPVLAGGSAAPSGGGSLGSMARSVGGALAGTAVKALSSRINPMEGILR